MCVTVTSQRHGQHRGKLRNVKDSVSLRCFHDSVRDNCFSKMSRWHEDWCVAHKVVVAQPDATPYCDNCRKSPDVETLRASIAASHAIAKPPPDEPPGQLNLFWPPTVPYRKPLCKDGERVVPRLDGPIASGTSSVVAGQGLGNDIAVRPFSSVYERPLEADEFRLLIIEPSANEDDPVHVTLEIYHDDDCPEYETVSYTWGGEEDDATLCRPVYFGPGWDIIFQTRNCHAMLCHLRPKRGLRLLWVDALCINQGDVQERGVQVAKMGSIYGSSRRVVVFLGPEIITPLAPGTRYPARRGLEELAHNRVERDGTGLRSVLERRYFGRIWILQELLLPRELLMRVWDKDYVANCRLSSLIQEQNPGWDWGNTCAPWLGRISQGRESDAATHLLRLAAGCAASDPRDLVFGLLGLLPIKWALEADYSLSARHVHIGFLAHCLLKCRDEGVFQFAGRRDLTSLPPWTHPIGTGSRQAEWLRMIPKRPRKGVPLGFSSDSSDDDDDDDEDNDYEGIERNQAGDETFYHSLQGDNLKIPTDLAWWNSAKVDCMDGSLTMKLVHFMPILAQPNVSVGDASFTFYTFAPPGGHELRLGVTSGHDFTEYYYESEDDEERPWLLFKGIRLVHQRAADDPPLDWIPGRDHIFVLRTESSLLIPLVLREMPNHPQGYRLVFCSHRLDLMFRFDDRSSARAFRFSEVFGLLSETVYDRLQLIQRVKESNIILSRQVSTSWLKGASGLFFDSLEGHEKCVAKLRRDLVPKPPPMPPGLDLAPDSFQHGNALDSPIMGACSPDRRDGPLVSNVTNLPVSGLGYMWKRAWQTYRGIKSTSRSPKEYLRRLRSRHTLIATEELRFCPYEFYEGSWTPPQDVPAAPDWPENVVDAYRIDGGVYEVTIF
ncbi:hypothetical protein MCOR14_006054 [Pyricularia oryzae]|nr:hypothetical protein MCOR14_006054 [Pyricularia oryzae]